jgi:hypothetical protein
MHGRLLYRLNNICFWCCSLKTDPLF